MLIVCYRLDGVGFKFQVTRPRTPSLIKGGGVAVCTGKPDGFFWGGRAGANIPPSIPKRVQSYYNFPRCPNLCTKYPASVITIPPKKQQKSVSYLADRLTHYSDSLCRKEKKYQQKMHFFTQSTCIYQFFVVSLYRVLKYEAPERQPTVRCSDEHPMTDYEIWDTGHPKTKNSPINN